jgi:hypothetical protein
VLCVYVRECEECEVVVARPSVESVEVGEGDGP